MLAILELGGGDGIGGGGGDDDNRANHSRLEVPPAGGENGGDDDAVVVGGRRRRWLRHRFDGGGGDDDDDEEDEEDEEDEDENRDAAVGAGGWAGAGRRRRPVPPHLTAGTIRPTVRTANDGIILDTDTSAMAMTKLAKFAAAGNAQAIYMIATILCYCHENVREGFALLRYAAGSLGHLPSSYALALMLRDHRRVESDAHLCDASSRGYLPAWQERLTATEVRAMFGDLDAPVLRRYLDPPCLSRLLGRHHLGRRGGGAGGVGGGGSRGQTSPCWNPACGRWAYKAPAVAAAQGDAAEPFEDDDDGVDDRRRRRRRQMRIARFQAYWDERFPPGGPHRGLWGYEIGAMQRQRRPLLGPRHGILEPVNDNDVAAAEAAAAAVDVVGDMDDDDRGSSCERVAFSIESLLSEMQPRGRRTSAAAGGGNGGTTGDPNPPEPSPLDKLLRALRGKSSSESSLSSTSGQQQRGGGLKVSRMKMCSSCRRAKYCSKLCQVYDWRSGKHKMECQFL